jgi:CRP-like cAMP-binding protein
MADRLGNLKDLPARDMRRLHAIPMLQGLSEHALRRLLSAAIVRRVPAGTTLFIQDEPADRFFVLLDGWVKLYRLGEDGTEAVVTIVALGETFAEAAMFASARFPVCAETVGEATVLSFDANGLSHSLADDPGIAFAMLGSLSLRLRHLVERIEQLQVKSAPQRVGDFLLRLCPGDGGPVTLTLPFSKALVARRLGMRPETFSRAMRTLRPLGVEQRGTTIAVGDIARLRAFCETDRTG